MIDIFSPSEVSKFVKEKFNPYDFAFINKHWTLRLFSIIILPLVICLKLVISIFLPIISIILLFLAMIVLLPNWFVGWVIYGTKFFDEKEES
ncbi:unnamed protein product [marine sediment metagenome]|uniref:Uncharacterized protein n=1 Tax=marine sediment metagenome TaxID=412755 RepID=X1DFV3_9ZZZZ